MLLPSGVKKYLPLIRQSSVTAGVSLNFFSHSCLIAFAAVLLPSLRSEHSTIEVTASEESWIASILALGLIAGIIINTPIMETFGRKKSFLLTIVPQVIGWAILYFTTTVAGVLIARFLQGISMGLFAALGPIIIGETSKPIYRGVMLSFISLSISAGNLVCHALGNAFTWRNAAIFYSFISLLPMVFVVIGPETPSWLIKQGRYEEGRRVFFWLRSQTDEEEQELEKMIMSQKMIRRSSIVRNSFSEKCIKFFKYINTAFHKPEFYKPVTIVFLTYTAFQFAGINILSSYALDIINQLVGPESNTETLMVALDIERLICNVLAIFLMKVVKRRTFLFTCGITCIVTYLAKALYLYAKRENILHEDYDSRWIPVTLIAIYVSVTTGISIIAFTLPGELMPLKYRGLGGGISASAGLSLNMFVAVKCFPVLSDSVGLPITYCLYAAVVGACLVVIYLMMPETKDRTLQDIEDSFKRIIPVVKDEVLSIDNKCTRF